MDKLLNSIQAFISESIPDARFAMIAAPLLILYTFAAAWLAGYLRTKRNVPVPYTRKIFHFTIFTSATILQFNFGLQAVVLFGVIVSAFVLVAVYKGNGFPFFESMARPTDVPHKKMFIIIPLITTAAGGVISNIFFHDFAGIGYLVGGFGDAVGEPVGKKYGKHKYKVPSLAGVPAQRSLEGSAAVFMVGSIAAVIGLVMMGFGPLDSVKTGILAGLAGATVEAFSNHGLDNLTIQVAASFVSFGMLSA